MLAKYFQVFYKRLLRINFLVLYRRKGNFNCGLLQLIVYYLYKSVENYIYQ